MSEWKFPGPKRPRRAARSTKKPSPSSIPLETGLSVPASPEELARLMEEAIAAGGTQGATNRRLCAVPESPLTEAELDEFRRLVREQARRQHEALKLYVPLPYQADFHASTAPERSLRASNRAGKTLAACVEVARAVTGQDHYGTYPQSGP